MSAADLAAVVVSVVSLAAVAALTVVLLLLLRSLRDLRAAVATLQGRTLPMLDEARAATVRAAEEAERVGEILDVAESVSARVDGASRVAYLGLSRPVIKTAAVATGAQRAARRLRRGAS
jgi:hypothetical protein